MCENDTKYKTDQLVVCPLRNGGEAVGRIMAIIMPGIQYGSQTLKEPMYKVHFKTWTRDFTESNLRPYTGA